MLTLEMEVCYLNWCPFLKKHKVKTKNSFCCVENFLQNRTGSFYTSLLWKFKNFLYFSVAKINEPLKMRRKAARFAIRGLLLYCTVFM